MKSGRWPQPRPMEYEFSLHGMIGDRAAMRAIDQEMILAGGFARGVAKYALREWLHLIGLQFFARTEGKKAGRGHRHQRDLHQLDLLDAHRGGLGTVEDEIGTIVAKPLGGTANGFIFELEPGPRNGREEGLFI